MVEEGTPAPAATPPSTEPTAPAPPATTPAAEPGTIDFRQAIGTDGKFVKDFRNFLPEAYRHEACLDTYDSLTELVRQHISLNKMIGKDKIVVPTDKSSQVEIDDFRKAIGVPEKAESYKMELPEESKEYFDENLMGQARQIFHTIGLNQKQVDALWKFEQERMGAALKSMEEEEAAEFAEAERVIEQKSGGALDEERHLANKLIADEYPDEAEREKLLEAINDNSLRPYLFNFLAGIQRKYRESHGGIPTADGSQAMTPAMLESKAKELQATPGYMDGTMKNNNPEGYKRLTQQITDLYNRAGKQASQTSR